MNKIKKCAIAFVFTFTMILPLGLIADAAETRSVGEKWVEKYYKMDKNISGAWSNKHDINYLSVPNSARWISDSKTRIDGGWNYDRYQFTNHYQSDLGWH